jgi:hypothetical protein
VARPFASATFPLTSHDIGTVSRFRLRQYEYMHEMAVLTLSNSSSFYPDFLTGSPVVVEWGNADRSDTFVGYVAFVNAAAVPSNLAPNALPGGNDLEVYCIGASFPMNEQRQTVYQGVTADELVTRVAQSYQLDVFTEPHPRTWPTYAQAGVSDWAFLSSLAHDVGYTLYAKNTQLKFHSRTLNVHSNVASALSYDYTGTENSTPLPDARQVIDFSPTIGNLGWDGNRRRKRVLYDLDRRTGTIIAARDTTGSPRVLGPLSMDPLFTEFVTAMSADNLQDASTWLLDMSEDQRWYITADAVVQGDVRLGPTQPIYFAHLPADFSGYWFIRGVEHDIQLFPGAAGQGMVASYTAALSLGRDGFGESVTSPSSTPIRVIDHLANLGTPTETVSTSQLTPAGYWRSSFQTSTVAVN